MHAARRWTLSAAIAVAAVGGPAAIARADDAGVKAAIKHQDRAISQSRQLKQLASAQTIKKADIPKLEKAIKALVPKFAHAARVVSATTASTSTGAAGQKAWVGGIRDIETGYRHVASELTDLERGNSTGAKRQLADARRVIGKGETLVLKADSDLGLPAGT
jgi:O6-methylguanine-DNA--protein-cysteine methyltransferase